MSPVRCRKSVIVLSFLFVSVALVVTRADTPTPMEAPPPPHPRSEGLEALPFVDVESPTTLEPQDTAAVTDLADWTQIVFQSLRDGNWEIYRADGDGSNQTRLTYDAASDVEPRLNRGCTRIAFVSKRTGNYEIFTMNRDGAGVTQLTFDGANDYGPAWSPDGTRIAFYSYRDGQAEIYVMNADGSGKTRLTWHGEYDGEPAWSPDGTRIAFVSKRTGEYHVWLMNADGSGKTQLSSQPYSSNPAWSPDGSQIAYDSDGDGDDWQELWLMNADGSNQSEVYDLSQNTDSWVRSWSPDGHYLAFTRISWIYYQGNWYWTEAYLDAWDRASGDIVRLSPRNVDWLPDWQTVDIEVPRSKVYALPTYAHSGFAVNWRGDDSGPAGFRSYDVQYRDTASGNWTDWQTETPYSAANFPGAAGHTYYFRSRARDNAYNVEGWPPGSGDSYSTLYTWAVDGTMRDNRGTPVVDGAINTTPGAFEARQTDSQGNYVAYVSEDALTYTVTWEKNGYGDLPATAFNPLQDGHADVILPPADNVVRDWGFENGSVGSEDWLTVGVITPVATSTIKHTGSYAALLGRQFAFAPPLNVPAISGVSSNGLLAVDATGVVHVVWYNRSGNRDDVYYSRRESDGTWSNPHNISDSSTLSEAPQMGVDEHGVVHVMWSEFRDGLYYSQRPSDGTWSTPIRIPNIPDEPSHPQLAIEESGVVHVGWVDSTFYHTWRKLDGTWSSPEGIPDTSHVRFPGLALGAGSTLHLAWEQLTGQNYEIYYARRDASGAWSSPRNISNNRGSSQTPEITVDESGTVHVAWLDDSSGQTNIFYARCGGDGTWSSPQNVSDTAGDSASHQLAVDARGVVHLVWRDTSSGNWGVYYARRGHDGAWSNPLQMSDADGIGPAQIVADATGAVHVVWEGGDSWWHDVYYAWRGSDGTWSSAINLSAALQTRSESPRVAMGTDMNVHVVWNTSNEVQYAGPALATQTGDSRIVQRVAIPITMSNPSLSFLCKLGRASTGNGNWFEVEVDDGLAATVLLSTTTDASTWTHRWFDLSPWAGQTVTLTLGVHQAAGQPHVWAYLDEITIGSAYPDVWVHAYDVAALPGEQAVHTIAYGNRGGVDASSVRITATLPSELSFVDADPPPVATTPSLEWEVSDLTARSDPYAIVVTTTVAPAATLFSSFTSTVRIEAASPELEIHNNQALATIFVGRRLYLPLAMKEYPGW